jgi:hypothetical protein
VRLGLVTEAIAARRDGDLRETIRLAAELEVDRIAAMAGPATSTPRSSD